MSYRITDVSFDPSKNDEFYAYADSLRDQLKAVNGLKFVHVIDVDAVSYTHLTLPTIYSV